MPKTLFLDTNIYLHYQGIDQIDWLRLLKTDKVLIVIPPITLRELNVRKDGGSVPHLRQRAAKVLKQLSMYFGSGSCARTGVSLYFESRDAIAVIDFTAHNLSAAIQDDHLIASMIMYRQERPDEDIVLVTSDEGLSLIVKATHHGISALPLPNEFRLPAEPDSSEKRIRELERQLAELQSASPKLRLAFENDQDHATFRLEAPVELTPEKLASDLEDVERRYPKMQDRAAPTVDSLLPAASRAAFERMISYSTISPEDIREYNDRLDRFYGEYAEYLRESARYENLKRGTIEIRICLVNDGTAPAEDIDVFMNFPDGFSLVGEDDVPEAPTAPEPPSKPKTAVQKMLDFGRMPVYDLSSIRSISSAAGSAVSVPENVSSPKIKQTNSYEVQVHINRAKHAMCQSLDSLYIVFEEFESASSFQVEYHIIAGNVPHEVSDVLHVVVEKDQQKQAI